MVETLVIKYILFMLPVSRITTVDRRMICAPAFTSMRAHPLETDVTGAARSQCPIRFGRRARHRHRVVLRFDLIGPTNAAGPARDIISAGGSRHSRTRDESGRNNAINTAILGAPADTAAASRVPEFVGRVTKPAVKTLVDATSVARMWYERRLNESEEPTMQAAH